MGLLWFKQIVQIIYIQFSKNKNNDKEKRENLTELGTITKENTTELVLLDDRARCGRVGGGGGGHGGGIHVSFWVVGEREGKIQREQIKTKSMLTLPSPCSELLLNAEGGLFVLRLCHSVLGNVNSLTWEFDSGGNGFNFTFLQK